MGYFIPKNPERTPAKYHGHTYVRGTPNCTLIFGGKKNHQLFPFPQLPNSSSKIYNQTIDFLIEMGPDLHLEF